MHPKEILFFNPRALRVKPRIPNSILQVAAAVDGRFDWYFVDGNMEKDPWPAIEQYLTRGTIGYFCVTVMPGPQMKQAVPVTLRVKEKFPDIKIIWGGYFPSNHPKVVMQSGQVDYICYGPADKSFPQLMKLLDAGMATEENLATIPNLIFNGSHGMVKTQKDELYDQDEIPPLNYARLDQFYPMKNYLGKTFMGNRTIAYHSSVGCPFKCAFCGLVPIYEARWRGKSAQKIYSDIRFLKEKYAGDAIEFHDNNFFVSEKRTVEFSHLMKGEKMQWWGEGRIDTIDRFKDESLDAMREGGCRMIFFGAETGNDELLKKMDKGGTQSGELIRRFAGRMKKFGITPEYSFILGLPAASDELVMKQIDADIAFIREIKDINPDAEIIIYVYSPVPTEGSQLMDEVNHLGFAFPKTLEEWVSPHWENFDLHRNPLTPWLKPHHVDRIMNFETVLNGYYPTQTDYKLSLLQRNVIHTLASWRYKHHRFAWPYELKVLQKLWLRYRQPEREGF